MRLDEFNQLEKNKIDFDLVEDALIFMRNDPMFYRKDYFPTMTRLADAHRSGVKYNPKKYLMPMITRGINGYCKKFNLANMPDDIFHAEQRQKLFDKIHKQEIDEINNGEYK